MNYTVTTNVLNGNLSNNRQAILEIINSFEGEEIELTFKKHRKRRSNPQNAYYHGVIIILFCEAIRTEWGELWSRDKAHEFLKGKFLFTERFCYETIETFKIPKSTTECTTMEFEDYLTQCREFLLEYLNVTAPLPNENITLE
jgi:hypothetical protein